MNTYLHIFVFTILSMIALVSNLANAEAVTSTLSGTVIRVADGDTVTVLDGSNQQHKIRVLGIDAPEKKQAFGDRSKQSMARMVFGKPVQVEWSKLDRYGRTIGKVMVSQDNCQKPSCPKTLDAGLAQISLGLAWHYKKYEQEQSAADRQLYAQEEMTARNKHLGLWSDATPIAPWDFRYKK